MTENSTHIVTHGDNSPILSSAKSNSPVILDTSRGTHKIPTDLYKRKTLVSTIKEFLYRLLGYEKARFIGTDGSMGLHKGKIYRIKHLQPLFFGDGYFWIQIGLLGSSCPYGSYKKFKENWSFDLLSQDK